MKIMFVGSEATPFVKTGGLADVLGSLPLEIAKTHHQVTLVLPAHKAIKRAYKHQTEFKGSFTIPIHTKDEYVGVLYLKHENIDIYLIDNEYYFGYREHIYGDYDDGERYGFFNQAVLAMLNHLKLYPDLLHLNDWQTGLIPYYLKTEYHSDVLYQSIKTVFTIHNIAYQGVFSKALLPYLNLLDDHRLMFDDQINFLKTALVTADKITTVSHTYAEELMYDYYGFGMSGILKERRRDLVGIMNGLDNTVFNPKTDQAIEKQYGVYNYLQGKKINKEALKNIFHLAPSNKPLVGMVSRLTEAKGFPLVERMIEAHLKQKRCQFVLLGSGDRDIEAFFNHLKQKYPEDVGVYFGYSDALARQIYAGADFFLMPSRFEPCGLAQLISMRYGTVPIVRETGGLKDSVLPYNKYTHDGTGFSFYTYTTDALDTVFSSALALYKNKKVFNTMIRRIMNEDFGWDKSAQRYIKIYNLLVEAK